MSYQHPYKDRITGKYYVDEVAYIRQYCEAKQAELRQKHPSSTLMSLVPEFDMLKQRAHSFQEVLDWVIAKQDVIGPELALFANETFEPLAHGPYWHQLKVLGTDDGPTPASDNPYSCLHVLTHNEPGYRLFHVMLYLGGVYCKNAGSDVQHGNFTGSYTVTLFAKDWAFVASRHLFTLLRHEQGIKKPWSGFDNPAAVQQIDFYHKPRASIIKQLLEIHFPLMGVEEFERFEQADLFPSTLEDFQSVLSTYSARLGTPKSADTSVVLPSSIQV